MLRAAKVRAERSESTLSYLREKGRQLIRVFGPEFDLTQITPADVDGYLDRRVGEGVALYTAGKEIKILFSALRLAKRHGRWLGDVDTLRSDELHGAHTPRDRWLTVPEFRKLLVALYPGRRDHLIAYVYLGVRYSELYRICPEHLDHAERRVFVDGTKTKKAKRWIPCADEVWDVLTRLATDRDEGVPLFRAWTRQNMRQALHRACAKAEIDPVSANDLRRTFASWLCSAGVPEMVCARLMGHTSSNMVRRVYAQLSDEALSSAIARMPRISTRPREAGGESE